MTALRIEERPIAYNNIDGVGELSLGIFAVVSALWFWDTKNHFLYWTALIGILHFGGKFIKQRITYPRTGLVEYRQRLGIAEALFWTALAVLLVTVHLVNWIPTPKAVSLVLGLFSAGGYGYSYARAVPWKWGVAATIATGSLAIAFGPWGRTAPEQDVILLLGTLTTISGAITFATYVRSTRSSPA